MPEAYYIIPSEVIQVGLRRETWPQYVNEIQCNWSGHIVRSLGVFVCLVNTTEAKHTDLAGRAGVRQMNRNYTWNTVISTMPAAARNFISNWCNSKNIPYSSSETIGQLLTRIIQIGTFDLGNTALNVQFQNLTSDQKVKIIDFCTKYELSLPANTETVRQMSIRFGPIVWPGNDRTKIHPVEF